MQVAMSYPPFETTNLVEIEILKCKLQLNQTILEAKEQEIRHYCDLVSTLKQLLAAQQNFLSSVSDAPWEENIEKRRASAPAVIPLAVEDAPSGWNPDHRRRRSAPCINTADRPRPAGAIKKTVSFFNDVQVHYILPKIEDGIFVCE
eukprot:TRINITY_DN1194_c0_g1_i1.p1 TRINITY_DN1194_c0_g1~~TRINITY_DN1194_c0_g1_i1.p1  ORF type:complete len:147 (-),score=29.82 TRINITY_DN1194_c0_g1_i1:39-479(-)